MAQKQKTAVIFGGTGFLGRHIVREFANQGIMVKVATRVPERGYFLKPYGDIGQIVPIQCDVGDAASVNNIIKGSDFVINCIGILFEKGRKAKFNKIHVDVPAVIAEACQDAHVEKFIHISALSCEKSTSHYGETKFTGEKAVLGSFPNATILRPSVVFGIDDNFFNMFAELARYTPALPLIGGGKTKFQPVYVGDIADSIVTLINAQNDQYHGKIFQLGGPDILTFKDIYEKLFEYTGRRCALIPVPFAIAKIQAFFMGFLPTPLLTPDQVESLKTDNIVDDGALGFKHLNISPKSIDLIAPRYLNRYKSGGRFSKKPATNQA